MRCVYLEFFSVTILWDEVEVMRLKSCNWLSSPQRGYHALDRIPLLSLIVNLLQLCMWYCIRERLVGNLRMQPVIVFSKPEALERKKCDIYTVAWQWISLKGALDAAAKGGSPRIRTWAAWSESGELLAQRRRRMRVGDIWLRDY